MLNKLKNSKSEGFTIIEVMIVLAIAGLIMLIVFLAVPSLQRNSRNTTRSNDASRIAAAVNECLSNRNGVVASCSTTAQVTGIGTLSQLTGATTFQTSGSGAAPASSTTNAGVWYSRSCTADNSASVLSTNAREFVVLYTAEPAVTRCLSS